MHYTGKGVTQDYTRAYMWFSISASQGHEKAAQNRDIVQGMMTFAQVAEAQRLARECVAKNYKGC